MKNKPKNKTMKYGTYSKRFLAFLIDYLIISIFISIIWYILGIGIPSEHYRIENFVFFTVPFLGWLIGIFYFGIMESESKQASYGKRAMGLKVCNEEGERISTWKSMVRNANKFLSGIYFMIGYILIFTSKKNQTLHDWLSNVVIVQSEK